MSSYGYSSTELICNDLFILGTHKSLLIVSVLAKKQGEKLLDGKLCFTYKFYDS